MIQGGKGVRREGPIGGGGARPRPDTLQRTDGDLRQCLIPIPVPPRSSAACGACGLWVHRPMPRPSRMALGGLALRYVRDRVPCRNEALVEIKRTLILRAARRPST